MSLFDRPQFASSEPVFATLMLTASISGLDESLGSRWARFQSSPHTYHERSPAPLELRMRTAHSRTPGATPTTPQVLSFAPTVPATCVPCPFSSYQGGGAAVLQLSPPAMFRSECGPIPVSTIATSASTRSSTPLILDSAEVGVPMREMPVGIDWASISTTSSGTT